MTIDADTAARLALVSLPGLGPARLRWLLAEAPAPTVVQALADGRLPPVAGPAPAGVTTKLVSRWTDEIRRFDPEVLAADATGAGVDVIGPGHRLWPFVDDPDPPGVLFSRGDLGLLTAGLMVAVIGTRRCSAIGRQVATELGRSLADAGLVVVSGLALGIDGCAHVGALAAGGRPVAVVGTGLDVVYPAANRRLWTRIGDSGLLLSEAPVGARPERWRFPARNRLIAALADAVVVVESHAVGGSLHTVHEALERGRLVMAVPGAVTNPAAAGTNQLLAEGCPPVRGVDDVLDALGVGPGGGPGVAPAHLPADTGVVPNDDAGGPMAGGSLGSVARWILDQVAAGSVHVDDLLLNATSAPTGGEGSGSGRTPGVTEVLAEIQRLVDRDLVLLDGATVSLRQQPPL